jgi:predicted nucleic acid-binding Zn ribbon protein
LKPSKARVLLERSWRRQRKIRTMTMMTMILAAVTMMGM